MMERRQFLRGLGLTGLAGAAGLGITPRGATATEGEAPKRLILISHCHGWPYESWKMRPAGVSESTPWEVNLSELSAAEFSQPLAPLYAHRERLLALDGLSLATAELDMDGNRHDTGWVQAWTGNWVNFGASDARSTSASVDQLVAERIARIDRLHSLELGVDDVREGGRPIAYGPSGRRLPIETSVERVWQRLFGPSLNPDPLMTRQRSVLEFAASEYKALAPKLDSLQRQRLDAHYDLVARLGDRIEGMASLTCPDVPKISSDLPTYSDRFDTMADMIGAALSCDITRVVTLSLGEMPTVDFGWDHLTDDVHKGLAHEIYSDAQKHMAMTDYLTMHAEQVARLVSVLEGIPDVDGQSVMDNTLIAWGSELANGWHGYQQYCPVLIGGSWHFRTGRYMYWPHETPIELLVPEVISATGYSSFSGMPHQRLLVSIAQAMGLDIQQIGIQHARGQSGHRVDCTGPIPDLV